MKGRRKDVLPEIKLEGDFEVLMDAIPGPSSLRKDKSITATDSYKTMDSSVIDGEDDPYETLVNKSSASSYILPIKNSTPSNNKNESRYAIGNGSYALYDPWAGLEEENDDYDDDGGVGASGSVASAEKSTSSFPKYKPG